MSTPPRTPRTQAARSAQTRARLVEATVGSLVERGFAQTTTVEVCARAGVTRGAYNHHYDGMAALFLDVLEELYRGFSSVRAEEAGDASLEDMVRSGWARIQHPDFKAVIELWMASRNDPELGVALAPAIARLSTLFEPSANPKLAKRLESDPALFRFYRLAFEATIGLALGRATSPGGEPVEHERDVIELLIELARERQPGRAGSADAAR